jgi:hypothetical protein
VYNSAFPLFHLQTHCRVRTDWAIAFAIGTGVPAIGALSGLIAAVCIFQVVYILWCFSFASSNLIKFTYTFPPLLMLGLDMQLDAMTEDEAFTTPGVTPKRIDTWRDLSRWKRGCVKF